MEDEKAGGATQGKVVLATVKGDVHDIGKNIVGVVLGCNNYEVIDLGVMVPAERILDTAPRSGRRRRRPLGPDHAVARPDGRRRRRRWSAAGSTLPLLIGGATTSRQHTAVRIAPAYSQRDGARARREPRRRRRLRRCSTRRGAARSTARTASSRSGCASSTPRRSAGRCSRSPPRARTAARVASTTCRRRRSRARGRSSRTLAELVPFVDWQFFFHAWDLKGKFPAILEQPGRARALRRRARACSRRSSATARCRPAACTASGRRAPRATTSSSTARASASCASRPTTATAGRTAASPTSSRPTATHGGAFAVAIHGADELAAGYEAEHDDYRSIIVKALADRLAEAFAEWLHAARAARVVRARRASSRATTCSRERYRGIRPAFGYPACPDHSEKAKLFDLLGAREARDRADRELRDDARRRPSAASTSRHPEARYFAVGRIGNDQLEDYAAPQGRAGRRGRALAAAEPRLNLGLNRADRQVG